MNSDIQNNQQDNKLPESEEVQETIPADGTGIVGDNTDHTLVMTRLWISDDVIENIEINVIGTDFIKSRAQNISNQIRGKKLDDLELIINYIPPNERNFEDTPVEVIYESIIRALDDYHNPVKKSELDEVDIKEIAETEKQQINETIEPSTEKHDETQKDEPPAD